LKSWMHVSRIFLGLKETLSEHYVSQGQVKGKQQQYARISMVRRAKTLIDGVSNPNQ
jgi:hypothetical protein